jgi:hypothetical protein
LYKVRVMKRIVLSVGLSLVWIALGYLILGVQQRIHYRSAFEQTKNGESLATILTRFGSPSHIEAHRNAPGYDRGERSVCGQSCWLRVWYEVPLTLGTSALSVDFDSQERVIDKYQWNSP